jgi:hypothetical protein
MSIANVAYAFKQKMVLLFNIDSFFTRHLCDSNTPAA